MGSSVQRVPMGNVVADDLGPRDRREVEPARASHKRLDVEAGHRPPVAYNSRHVGSTGKE
jgi:hypothetical protein